MSDDLVTVQFLAPSEHAFEFQQMGHAWLAERVSTPRSPGPDGKFIPASSRVAKDRDVWHATPWGPGDGDRAEWLVGSLKPHPRDVLRLLCERAGEWITSGEIAEQVGLNGPKSVPPSFKSLANRCRRADRRAMWDWDQGGYMVKVEVAAIFRPLL